MHMPRDDLVKEAGVVIYKPGRNSQEAKPAHSLVFDFWLTELPREINFCCLNHLLWVFYCGNPSKKYKQSQLTEIKEGGSK